ncbi:hypothetical protein Plhal304r1_c028g0092811 [Plasmopara halstedii]
MDNLFSCANSYHGVRKLFALFLYRSGGFFRDILMFLINQINNFPCLMVWAFNISDFVIKASCTFADNSLRISCKPHQHISALMLPTVYRLVIDKSHKRT